jgi:hypothetical protein
MYEMNLLDQLAKKHETDKGGFHYRYGGGDSDTCHNFCREYHAMFEGHQHEVKHVLEIGINAGSSLRMWKEYFPSAMIIGLDSDARCLVHDEDRIMCLAADQGDPTSLYQALGKLREDAPMFDLIVDDGSHQRDHQITSMRTLLPFLAPWGYYVIEDLGTGEVETLTSLWQAVPDGYGYESIKITGGLGPKVQPHEWLFVVTPCQKS